MQRQAGSSIFNYAEVTQLQKSKKSRDVERFWKVLKHVIRFGLFTGLNNPFIPLTPFRPSFLSDGRTAVCCPQPAGRFFASQDLLPHLQCTPQQRTPTNLHAETMQRDAEQLVFNLCHHWSQTPPPTPSPGNTAPTYSTFINIL